MDDEDLHLLPRTRADDLLSWAAEEGLDPVPEPAVRTVLTLLELGGARLHDGLPELTSPVLEHLLYEQLHLYVQPDGDPAAYPAAVRLLIEWQRAARRLNTKRTEKLRAETDWQGEVLLSLLRRADLVTWPRLYALLLRADEVPVDDPDAVRAWLTAFRALPEADRFAAFDRLPGLDGDGQWDQPGRPLLIGVSTDGARRLLEQGLMRRSYRNLAERSARGLPMPDELAGGFEEFEEAVAQAAIDLCGEWTVPGLPRLLLEEFPDLAPEEY
ncbi:MULTISPECIES: hypothetical protein [Kitasatospora]|uniref:Uncharacterized protein n=1 Tax=Kitasatospora setae (strain ATCC 33774 / DSM 43861 / JCM 3304 / KCC A-0304 / NBRC 14216 / KM-6054) TaxID=452652 RepID=E4NEZ5_KITSK|nr:MULTISPECIES: hypothetical protein [Kitasatospora]BAJ30075.1 hypothetical protein KSE_42900 [Kitasatospora setae KM-6054]